MFDKVLEKVEEQCRAERVPMLGPDKAKLLASCVEKAKKHTGSRAGGDPVDATAWRSASIVADAQRIKE